MMSDAREFYDNNERGDDDEQKQDDEQEQDDIQGRLAEEAQREKTVQLQKLKEIMRALGKHNSEQDRSVLKKLWIAMARWLKQYEAEDPQQQKPLTSWLAYVQNDVDKRDRSECLRLFAGFVGASRRTNMSMENRKEGITAKFQGQSFDDIKRIANQFAFKQKKYERAHITAVTFVREALENKLSSLEEIQNAADPALATRAKEMVRLRKKLQANTTLQDVTTALTPGVIRGEEDLSLLKEFALLCTGETEFPFEAGTFQRKVTAEAASILQVMQTYAEVNILRKEWAQEVEDRVQAFIDEANATAKAEAKAKAEAEKKAAEEAKAKQILITEVQEALKKLKTVKKETKIRKIQEGLLQTFGANLEKNILAAENLNENTYDQINEQLTEMNTLYTEMQKFLETETNKILSAAGASKSDAAAPAAAESGAAAPKSGAAAGAAATVDQPYLNYIKINTTAKTNFSVLNSTEKNVVRTIFNTFLEQKSDRTQLAIQKKFEQVRQKLLKAKQKDDTVDASLEAAFFKLYAEDEPYLEFYYSTDVWASKVAAPSADGQLKMIAFAIVSEADTSKIERIRNNGATKEIQLLKRLPGDEYKTAGSNLLDIIFANDSDNTFVIEPNNARVAYYYRNNVQRERPDSLVKVKQPVETKSHNPWSPKSWAEELTKAKGTSEFVQTLKKNGDIGRMQEWICGIRETWAQKLKKGNKTAANQRLIAYINKVFAKDGSDKKDPQGNVQPDAVWQEMWRAKFLDFFFESKAYEVMSGK